MGIGTSLVLIAIGAILKFAVTASVSGVKLEVVGTILMVIGIVGLVITLIYTVAWNDRRRGTETVVERRDRY
jgi:heme/copper-type cytochrome/quinol oxidase subunit 2